jgi:predicted RND superfamily exporter protein
MLQRIYERWVFRYPIQIFALLLVGLFSFGYYATKLEIDASSETLLLDDDADLRFSREMAKHFKGENFLVITYQPNAPMLSDESLETLKKLSYELIS